MIKEFTTGEITQRLLKKQQGCEVPTDPAVERIASEIYAAAREEDGIIRYFSNCETSFATLGVDAFDAVSHLDEIKEQILDLIEQRLAHNSAVSFDDLIGYALAIHQLKLEMFKPRLH